VSTNFNAEDWISQAEAARLRGVSRQAIAKLVKAKRLRTIEVGGHILIFRSDVLDFEPKKAGRRKQDGYL
jgi:excisionase family DNA binding protein